MTGAGGAAAAGAAGGTGAGDLAVNGRAGSGLCKTGAGKRAADESLGLGGGAGFGAAGASGAGGAGSCLGASSTVVAVFSVTRGWRWLMVGLAGGLGGWLTVGTLATGAGELKGRLVAVLARRSVTMVTESDEIVDCPAGREAIVRSLKPVAATVNSSPQALARFGAGAPPATAPGTGRRMTVPQAVQGTPCVHCSMVHFCFCPQLLQGTAICCSAPDMRNSRWPIRLTCHGIEDIARRRNRLH